MSDEKKRKLESELHRLEEEAFVKSKDTDTVKRSGGLSWAVCLDGSEKSERALQWTLNVANKQKDHIIVLVVQEPVLTNIPHKSEYFTRVKEQLTEELHHRYKSLAEKYASIFTETGVYFSIVLLQGDPKEKIVQYVERNDVDNLVLGRRGVSDSERRLLGSVSEHCLRHAHATVIIVK